MALSVGRLLLLFEDGLLLLAGEGSRSCSADARL